MRRSLPTGLAAVAALVTAVTLVLYPLRELDPGVSSGVLYVLGVLLISVYWGLGLGIVTSVASAFVLFYLHTDPVGLHAKDAGDIAAISVMLLTAAVGSMIADSARRREADRARADEMRDSRARVMEAADAERRRVVRDLHDGAQQRLVHTIITLQLADRALDDELDGARPLLGEALDHAQQAISELRELARGILPPALSRGGLRAGVDTLVARMPIPVSARVDGERLPPVIESTAYFVVAEALTNVLKHSQAQSARVRAGVAGGELCLEVRDDGVGGARRSGGGLRGLEDRVGVLDGTLDVRSPPGGGTVVAARIPLAGQLSRR